MVLKNIFIILSFFLIANLVNAIETETKVVQKPLNKKQVKSNPIKSSRKQLIKDNKGLKAIVKNSASSSSIKKNTNQKTDRKILSTDVNKSTKAAQKEVQNQLNVIVNLCQIKSLVIQVNQLENSLSVLRKVILEQLENPDLSVSDGISFREIYYGVAEPGLFTTEEKLTVKIIKKQQLDLAESFLYAYQVKYNLDAIRSLDQFRHEWARKVYQGLKCVKLPPGKEV